MVLEMLNIIEAWPLHDGKMNRADIIDCQVAAKKLAFEDRIRHLEDPAFGDLKISRLISKEYAAKRRNVISEAAQMQPASKASLGGDTTWCRDADRDGNEFSLIQSSFA